MSSNQYTVNIVNADELYIGGRKIQALELGVLVSDDASYGIGIGTDKPRLKLDISGADGIRIPVGTTGERPINDTFLVANGVAAPNGAKNLLGILRYNTTTEKYEAVCDSENLTANPSWCNFVIETGTNVGNNKVGINTGTVTPSQTLDVSGQIGINDYIIHNGDTNNTKIGFPTNDTLTITTGGTERMRVDPSGNVGIGTTGTTNPKGNLHVFNSTLNTTSDLLSTSINRWTNAPSLTTDIYYNYLENTLVSSESPDWSTVPRYGFKLGSWRNSISSGLILKTINSATIDWKTRLKINHNGFFYFNSPDSHLEKFYSPYHFSFKPIGNGKYGDPIPTNSKINDLTFSNFSTAQPETKNIFGEYPVFIGKGCSLYSDASPNLANTKFIAFSEEGSSGSQNFYGGGIMLNDKIHFITYNKIQTTSGLTDSDGNTITDGAELQLSTYTRMTIDETGKVGIGVTLPYSKFTIGFKDTTTQDSTNLSTSGITAAKCYIGIGKQEYLDEHKKLIGFGYVSSSSNYYPAYIGYQEKNTSSNTYGDLIFGTRSSTSQSVEPTERMRIRYDGNVGIGVTDPDEKLEVAGNILLSGNIHRTAHNNGCLVGSYNRVGSNGNMTNPIYCIGSNYLPSATTLNGTGQMYGIGYCNGTATFIEGNATGWGMYIASDANARVFLSGDNGYSYIGTSSSSRLGIGTTSPTQTLDVNGAIGMAHYIYHNGDTNTYFGFPTTDAFAVTTSGTERMRIDSAGNVGIGTTSPEFLLHLKHIGDVTLRLEADSNDSGEEDNPLIHMSQDGGGGWFKLGMTGGVGEIYTNSLGNCGFMSSYDDMQFATGGTARMTILENGNVGIGTTSPRCTLNTCKRFSSTLNTIPTGVGSSINDTASLFLGKGTLQENNYWGLLMGTTYNGHSYIFPAHKNDTTHYDLLLNPHGGSVGIGVTSSNYTLHVDAESSSKNGGQRTNYFNDTANEQLTSTSTNFTVSIYGTNAIFAEDYIVASDERIKENITVVPDDLSLKILRNIECYYYNYIDNDFKQLSDENTEKTIGFIAQQVAEHCELAVEIINREIPNEYRNIKNPQWEEIDVSGNTKYKLTIDDLKGDYLKHTKYKFIVRNVQSTGIVNDPDGKPVLPLEIYKKIITSMENDAHSFIFDMIWDNVFLFGHEVDDFHVLKKERLWAINFSATQEIDKIQQGEKTKLEEQTSKLAAAETKLAAAETEIATLKTTLTDVLARLAALELN